MFTPPYHFSIVATPSLINPYPTEILYRGSIPAARNLTSLRRLHLRTLVYLRKKELKDDDALREWAKREKVELRWVKVEEMGEESLGMGRMELGEVLKIILDPSAYPLYIADLDGISHTTLIIACLRKLQGWHMDSIINEICRFEPDHEDTPLVSFITSYLTPSTSNSSTSGSGSSVSSSTNSDQTFQLPQPPYPSWLWPTNPLPTNTSIFPTTTQNQNPNRERAISNSTSLTGTTTPILPFPHPMTARRHPSMRLTFPPILPSHSPIPTPTSPPLSTSTKFSLDVNPLSRVASRKMLGGGGGGGVLDTGNQHQSLIGEAAGLLARLMGAVGAGAGGDTGSGSGSGSMGKDREKDDGSGLSNEMERGLTIRQASSGPGVSSLASSSPENLSRKVTGSSQGIDSGEGSDVFVGRYENQAEAEHEDEEDEEDEEEEEEEEDEEDEEDEEEEAEDQTASQYISALDLAGFG